MYQGPSRIRLDTSQWPVVIVHFDGQWHDEEFETYLDGMTEVLMRPGVRALIYDASNCTSVSASQRRMKAEWMKQNRATISHCTAGIAFVLPGALVRGVLTAILWMSPLPAPHAVVASLDEAQLRCEDWLNQHKRALSA